MLLSGLLLSCQLDLLKLLSVFRGIKVSFKKKQNVCKTAIWIDTNHLSLALTLATASSYFFRRNSNFLQRAIYLRSALQLPQYLFRRGYFLFFQLISTFHHVDDTLGVGSLYD